MAVFINDNPHVKMFITLFPIQAGNNVTANPVTINAALSEFADAFTSKFAASVQDGASANAWPMATYSYLLIHTR
jgi:hypothetical protein